MTLGAAHAFLGSRLHTLVNLWMLQRNCSVACRQAPPGGCAMRRI